MRWIMPDDHEEFWTIPVFFHIARKDAINAFELFSEKVIKNLPMALGHCDEIIFMLKPDDMVKHVHKEHCTTTPISKEDVNLINKLTLPPELLKKIDEARKEAENNKPCKRCLGKGKIKTGDPPVIEVIVCPDCKGKKTHQTH